MQKVLSLNYYDTVVLVYKIKFLTFSFFLSPISQKFDFFALNFLKFHEKIFDFFENIF